MKLAVTADLHWGHNARGDAATRRLVEDAERLEVDAFAIAGDVGEAHYFGECLALFAGLRCARLVVPGNHDLWVHTPAASSLVRYEEELPAVAARHGFQYLDQEPCVTDGDEAVVGSINWYDYSFAAPEVEEAYPAARRMYERKLFPNARHNDGRLVRLGMSDDQFTERVVSRFRSHLRELPARTRRVITIQHHPPVRELFYPTKLTAPEQMFWLAYTGNRRMQDAVKSDLRITDVLCGHTHAHCAASADGKRCINVGGDYHWKRLLLLDTDTGEEQWWDFEG